MPLLPTDHHTRGDYYIIHIYNVYIERDTIRGTIVYSLVIVCEMPIHTLLDGCCETASARGLSGYLLLTRFFMCGLCDIAGSDGSLGRYGGSHVGTTPVRDRTEPHATGAYVLYFFYRIYI